MSASGGKLLANRSDEPLQISQAVLQPDNMGDGWTATPSTEDEGGAPGCLADVESITEGLEEKAQPPRTHPPPPTAERAQHNGKRSWA